RHRLDPRVHDRAAAGLVPPVVRARHPADRVLDRRRGPRLPRRVLQLPAADPDLELSPRRRGTRGRYARNMSRVLVLNGPNLGRLGSREPDVYGAQDLSALRVLLTDAAAEGTEIDL